MLAGHLLARSFLAVPAMDGLSLGSAALALAAVVVLASLLPAWRSSRADPAVVLRQE
jgi:ABC-type lipoprotein release transport system permease subunit